MVDTVALTRVIEPEVEALGYRLVRVAMIGGTSDPTLQVMAERPDTRQLSLDDCGALSRAISDMLDAVDPIEGAYRLEVSSPGIDRPLTRLADYADWAGHVARVRLARAQDGRKQFEGRLAGIEREAVKIEIAAGVIAVPFAEILAAKLLLTDELIKATAPLSTEGADRIVQEG